MKFVIPLVLTVTITVCVTSGFKSYSGYQVVRTKEPLTWHDVGAVTNLLNSQTDARFMEWQQPVVGRSALIMAAPQHVHELRHELDQLGLPADVFIEDVETVVQDEREKILHLRSIAYTTSPLTFKRYMEPFEIEDYIDEVEEKYPDSVKVLKIGSSHEGRPIRVLKVSSLGRGPKPAVLIDGGLHGSEWLGPAAVMYGVQQLTKFAARNEELLAAADWYFLILPNPDGYVHSWIHDRLWRKNRRVSNETECEGVSLNRNFDIKWGGGNVTDPCAKNYPGTHANSEPETKALAEFLKKMKGKMSVYLSMYSNGPMLLHPYGYKNTNPPQHVITAAHEAAAAAKIIRGTNYAVGSIANLQKPAYGTSVDYAHDVTGVPYTYAMELPTDGERLPPPEVIHPVVQEAWHATKALVLFATTPAATPAPPQRILYFLQPAPMFYLHH